LEATSVVQVTVAVVVAVVTAMAEMTGGVGLVPVVKLAVEGGAGEVEDGPEAIAEVTR
jgi:hypothetical protein